MIGKKYLDLECSGCGKSFVREEAWQNKIIKKGWGEKAYCNRSCYLTNRTTINSYFKDVFRLAKSGARQRKKDFIIELNDIINLWEKQKELCAYTGIKMTLEKGGEKKPSSLSLDRINSNIGYTKENIHLVCLFVNYGKNGFSHDETLDFVKQLI